MNLGTRERQAIDAASRLDLAVNLLSGNGRRVLETIGVQADVRYHSFGNETRLLCDETVLPRQLLTEFKATESRTSIVDALENVTRSGGG